MLYAVTPTDLPELEKWIKTEFPYLQQPQQKLQYKLNHPSFFLFKTEQQGKMTGFIEIELLEPFIHCRINGLVIQPNYRKQGIGNQLLQETILFCRMQGYRLITLLVKQTNHAARKLYEKNGFVLLRTLPKPIDQTLVDEYALPLQQPIA